MGRQVRAVCSNCSVRQRGCAAAARRAAAHGQCPSPDQRDGAPVIPETVLEKPPSAELRPDQKDEDSLPPYSVLDSILELYVEQDHGFDEIVAAGHDPDIVKKVIALYFQYKQQEELARGSAQ